MVGERTVVTVLASAHREEPARDLLGNLGRWDRTLPFCLDRPRHVSVHLSLSLMQAVDLTLPLFGLDTVREGWVRVALVGWVVRDVVGMWVSVRQWVTVYRF